MTRARKNYNISSFNRSEECAGVPKIDFEITVSSIKSKSRILKVKIAPPKTRCGEVMTMEGPRRLKKCRATFKGDYMSLPKGWSTVTTGPGHYGYFYAVCPKHKP